MRVIAGKARSLRLKSPEGMETRPTTDRIRETLFNMLRPYLADCRFLDLFSGSGAIGIEALSRGAKTCVFVEKNRRACACIRENLAFTGFTQEGRLFAVDVFRALRDLDGEAPFDLIFMDPPYGSGLALQVLTVLGQTSLADEKTLVIVEESMQLDLSSFHESGFDIVRDKTYGTNRHLFLRKAMMECTV